MRYTSLTIIVGVLIGAVAANARPPQAPIPPQAPPIKHVEKTHPYWTLRKKAIADDIPLVIWLGYGNEHIRSELQGWHHYNAPLHEWNSFAAKGPGVIIGVPKGEKLNRVDLLARECSIKAMYDAVRNARGNYQESQQTSTATTYSAPVMMYSAPAMMGGYGGGMMSGYSSGGMRRGLFRGGLFRGGFGGGACGPGG